ncbi:MAG: PASTA domain-containing protein [Bacteroidetes bacterium]|nr:PASTA domain-containing protein [Bacteroidota bacterium]
MLGSLRDFIKSKTFLYSIISMAVLLFVSLFLLYNWLNNYTHHGESITVPDVRGLTEEKLVRFIQDKHLQYKIVDSLFEDGKAPGTVIEQDPKPDSKVKENRTIYLTVNSSRPPKVKMPDLVDVSYRQAEAILQTFGLRVGQTIYKPDLAKNAVLGQSYKGRDIAAGTEIFKGSAIDLILGDGLGNSEVPVPNLVSLTKGEALFVLKGSSLNIGTITFDPGVKNEENAKVYKQNPEADGSATIKQGEAVDIFLR